MKRLNHIIVIALLVIISENIFANTIKKQHSEVELISEVEHIKADRSFWLALRFKLDKDWHIYWKNPGGISGQPPIGQAPTIKWILPKNFKANEIQWPYPTEFETPLSDSKKIINYGYSNEVFLLVKIQTPKIVKQRKITIIAKARWLICKTVCIQDNENLKITLPVSNNNPKPIKKWIIALSKARAKLPIKQSQWMTKASYNNNKIQIKLSPNAEYNYSHNSLYFYPEEHNLIDYNAKQVLKPNHLLEVKAYKNIKEPPKRLKGVLVSSTGWRGKGSEPALYIDIPLSTLPIIIANNKHTTSIFTILIFALIGGLILNLMPCVFPVLSIKVLNFIEKSKKDKAKLRLHGIIFTFGVLISLWVLVIILIILRKGGMEVGWGFHLQSPTFVIVIAALFFLFALNLFGLFEISIFTPNIDSKISKSGYLSSFLTGIITVVVATPCSAPFMGTALAFALSQSSVISLLIFTFLALGLSIPYLLLSFFPRLIRLIPPAGKWMESFKQFLGFLLMASVIWLIWVLDKLGNPDSVVIMLMALLIMSFGVWIYGRWGTINHNKKTRVLSYVLTISFIVGGFVYARAEITKIDDNKTNINKINSSYKSKEGKWEIFSPKRVEELRKNKVPIFINFTASWCLSCQWNTRTVLNTKEVMDKFREYNVTLMKADWTNNNPVITKELAKLGRASVPVYVLYTGGKNNDPVILPELLTKSIVIDELDKIK